MANITFCKARFTLWPGERSGPARMHRRSNAVRVFSAGCQGEPANALHRTLRYCPMNPRSTTVTPATGSTVKIANELPYA